jgi:hypothetical protein
MAASPNSLLQFRARLVPQHISHYYRELAGGTGPAVDGAGRRRLWSCVQTRRPASQCFDQRLLQRRAPNGGVILVIAYHARIAISGEVRTRPLCCRVISGDQRRPSACLVHSLHHLEIGDEVVKGLAATLCWPNKARRSQEPPPTTSSKPMTRLICRRSLRLDRAPSECWYQV